MEAPTSSECSEVTSDEASRGNDPLSDRPGPLRYLGWIDVNYPTVSD